MREGIKGLGALDEDIIEIANCDFRQLSDLFADLNKKADLNFFQGKKTFFFLYYGGHAILDSTTKAVLNMNEG